MSNASEKLVLIETMEAETHPLRLLESDGKTPGLVRLEGTAIQGEVRNHNGRVYPKNEIERAVESMMEKIKKTGPILGECDHPDGLNINLDRVTHVIKDIHMEGNDGISKIELIDEGLGKTLAGILRRGALLGVSSRGSGNVDRDGVVSDFDIVTIDIVATPSAPGAYPKPIIESLMRSNSGQRAMGLAEIVRHDPKAQRHFAKELLTFLTELQPRKHNG